MSDESSPRQAEKKQIGADLVIPVAALVFTLYFFYTIVNWPWNPADDYIAWDARVTAFSIGAILIALIVVFIALNVLTVIRGEANFGFKALTEPLSMIPRRMALFALTLAFIVFVEWGGFTITTFFFLSAAMLLLTRGRNWKFVLVLSAVLSVGGYFLFIYAFHVRFHKGPFEILMSQVL